MIKFYKRKTVVFIIFIVCISKVFCEGFIAGTLIKAAIDQYIPIEMIEVGDNVYCCDAAGTFTTSNVTAAQSYEASKLIQLFFENETITCVSDQLFYLGESIGWRKAHDLHVGDHITSAEGDFSMVQAIETLNEIQVMYDITVEDYHNFYVSQSALLVHNVIFLAAGPVVAPVVGSAVVTTAIETAAAVGFVAGCIYSLWETVSKKNKNASGAGGGGNGRCFCVHYCSFGCNCGCSCGCGKDESEWKKNTVSKQEFFKNETIKTNYEHVRDGVYKLKKGGQAVAADAIYLQWDHLHGDVEVYSKSKRHIGSLDPKTLKLYKPAVYGREFPLQ